MSSASDTTPNEAQRRKLIFLSHASPDSGAAGRLAKEIEEAGFPCWMAPRDVPFGANFGEAIIDAIETTEVFVVLLSANANSSIHVSNEIERAVNYRKTIIPVRLENVRPSRANELHLSARQWVDLFGDETTKEANMRRLLNALRDVLREWLVPDLPPLGEQTISVERSLPVETATAAQAVPVQAPIVQTALPVKERSGSSVKVPSPVGPVPPSSDPAVRAAIENDVRDLNLGTVLDSPVGPELFSKFGLQAVVELCAIALDARTDLDRAKAVGLLTRLASQPGSRSLRSTVLDVYARGLKAGGDQTTFKVLYGIRILPVPPRDKWEVLFRLLPSAQNSGLVALLVETTPREKVRETGDAIAELLLSSINRDIQIACLAALKALGSAQTAPVLRELLETTTDGPILSNVSNLLAGWGDRESSASIQHAAENIFSDPPRLAEVLHALHRLEGSASVEFIVGQFLDSPHVAQVRILSDSDFRAIAEPALIQAVEQVASSSPSIELKRAASEYMAVMRR